MKLLHDKSDDIVYATLLALGELDGHKTGDDVIACLGHANANIRRAAVWALAKLRYERAIPHFIRMLRTDESQVVRQEIAKRLGQMGGPLAVAPLVSAKAHDADHNVRIYAEWALADIPLNNKEATLLKLADGPDHAIRG